MTMMKNNKLYTIRFMMDGYGTLTTWEHTQYQTAKKYNEFMEMSQNELNKLLGLNSDLRVDSFKLETPTGKLLRQFTYCDYYRGFILVRLGRYYGYSIRDKANNLIEDTATLDEAKRKINSIIEKEEKL